MITKGVAQVDDEITDDISDTLGRPLTPVEERQSALWVEQARILIRRRLGDLSLLDQSALRMVVTEAVAARLKRPDDARTVSRQVSIDDGSVQHAATYERATGQIQILPEWWDLLTPDTAAGSAFSIRPYSAGSGFACG